jgi:hypothetical protein
VHAPNIWPQAFVLAAALGTKNAPDCSLIANTNFVTLSLHSVGPQIISLAESQSALRTKMERPGTLPLPLPQSYFYVRGLLPIRPALTALLKHFQAYER